MNIIMPYIIKKKHHKSHFKKYYANATQFITRNYNNVIVIHTL